MSMKTGSFNRKEIIQVEKKERQNYSGKCKMLYTYGWMSGVVVNHFTNLLTSHCCRNVHQTHKQDSYRLQGHACEDFTRKSFILFDCILFFTVHYYFNTTRHREQRGVQSNSFLKEFLLQLFLLSFKSKLSEIKSVHAGKVNYVVPSTV